MDVTIIKQIIITFCLLEYAVCPAEEENSPHPKVPNVGH